MVLKRFLIFTAIIACLVGVVRLVQKPVSSNLTGKSAVINIAEPHDDPIPNQALRLRIIANSDSPKDQQLKREVRDAVIVKVGGMLKDVKSESAAEQDVKKRIPEIDNLAAEIVKQHGYQYAVQTEVGKVPFPTKQYGNMVYPAGTYEALRIVIGKGQGQNWWCVLFPPLCFVDIASGDAVPNTGGFPDLPPLETVSVPGENGKPEKVQVRVAALDYGEELIKSTSHLLGK